MNQIDTQPVAIDQAYEKVPDEDIWPELLYPAAGILVVLVLWWLWLLVGADWVRNRIEAGVSAKPLAEARVTNEAPVARTAGASPPLSGDANAGVVPPRPPSATSDSDRQLDAEKGKALSDRFSQLGQTGDLFGGVNALFAAVALIGVFWAATMQWRSLSEGRRAAAEQRFETVFFELLRLTREVLERIEIVTSEVVTNQGVRVPNTTKVGASALNALASRHFARFRVTDSVNLRGFFLQQLVREYKSRVYGAYPSALGPYFRLLFQTFDLVASAPIDEKKRTRYSNIARGQISEGAVLLLALNGLTWRGWKFVPLIERFGLLEHMHQRYLREFQPLLRVAYRERAFQGSELRAKSSNEPPPSPGPYKFDVDPASPDFVITSPMSVPSEGL